MDKQTKTKIRNMVLDLREGFEKEIENRLNYFGIYPDKEWKHLNALTYLKPEEKENRKKVAAFIKRMEALGLARSEAVKEFIKEASYTWINRLVGLKCMESRGILDDEIITTRPEYGNRSKRHRDFREKHPDLASRPDDGFIPCLFEVFSEITEEIKVLFDPESEYSLVIPRYPFLKKVIETINTELEYDTYKEDELLGWVYQYFQTEEKDRIFKEVRTKKKKISGSDIIPVTSLYTEKYMVKFLVENSLGALWQEMYPDSNLKNKWEYFVEDPNNSTRKPRPVKEVTFLDPACGSGHFLLYAFDLFYDMYKEERERNPEWAVPEEEIPEYILRYNLHGTDIDLRSIQISALGFYMKAKQKIPDLEIKQMNLVAANAVVMNSEILQDFLVEFKGDPMAQELINLLWRGLKDLRELGSLLKIEEQIDSTIKQAKNQPRLMAASKGGSFTWEGWKKEILEALKRYYERAIEEEGDINKQLFAREAEKGLNFIDLVSQKYDVVATNPPYMSNRNTGKNLKKGLKELYPNNNNDLYATFIERCNNLGNENSFTAMITQQSFMFRFNFITLREVILNNNFIRTIGHLGPHAFRDISGEKVNTVMSIFIKQKRYENKSVFLRLYESSDKENDLADITKGNSNLIYLINQDIFEQIEGHPFVYWLPNKIFDLIINSGKIEELANLRNGMFTGDNDRFLRFFWEIDPEKIGKKWFYYIKGGGYNKWFGNLDLYINWEKDGKKVKDFAKRKYGKISYSIYNERYFFKEGLTYTLLSSKGFNIRYLPDESIFDHAGDCIFTENVDLYFLLGYLNSRFASYILYSLNPTIAFTTYDLKRIPFKYPNPHIEKRISSISEQCINIKKNLLQFVINDREFKHPALMWGKKRMEDKI